VRITLSARNFTVSKGFQYQVDGGSWVTVIPSPAATTGSVTLTNLTSKIYNNIRYDDSSNGCAFALAQEWMPTTVTASALSNITNLRGATIRATGRWRYSSISYELRQSNGTTVVTAFNNNRDFTNVPVGEYRFIRDEFMYLASGFAA
jgi:hypothetical protein